MDNKCGGFGPVEKATEEIQKMCDEMKSKVEAKRKKTYKVFTAVKYCSQIVNGTIYFIKVDVGECIHIYLRILQNLSGDLHLVNVQPDPIKPEENVAIRPGGYTEPKDPTDEIHKICAEMKPQVEARKNSKYEFFTVVKYRSQIVAGTNYHIKVDVGECIHIYLIIYQNLSGDVELTDVQLDPIQIV